jgi:hypothetical protein
MAISENVKRQAMDAVSHKETTAEIRRFTANYTPSPPPIFSSSEKVVPIERGAIPEHVKKQAMDAVAKLRPPETEAAAKTQGSQPLSPSVHPEQEKKAAMDVGNHPETKAYLRLVKSDGPDSPLATPNKSAADKIVRMQKAGHDADLIHRQATKDNFVREHE